MSFLSSIYSAATVLEQSSMIRF